MIDGHGMEADEPAAAEPVAAESSAPPLPIEMTENQASAIKMLRGQTVAPLPRGSINPNEISSLRRDGLIQMESWGKGLWSLTEEGKKIDLGNIIPPVFPVRKSHTWYIDPVPSPVNAEILSQAYRRIDSLMPGDELFGRKVRESALIFLEGKPRGRKFIYFSYPVGFPLKHIAWAANVEWPMWTAHYINVARYQLGVPASRMKRILEERNSARVLREAEQSLVDQLRAEGCEPWEIEEYFGAKIGDRIVL